MREYVHATIEGTETGDEWHVTVSRDLVYHFCDCPAFKYAKSGKLCKHINALRDAIRVLGGTRTTTLQEHPYFEYRRQEAKRQAAERRDASQARRLEERTALMAGIPSTGEPDQLWR